MFFVTFLTKWGSEPSHSRGFQRKLEQCANLPADLRGLRYPSDPMIPPPPPRETLGVRGVTLAAGGGAAELGGGV